MGGVPIDSPEVFELKGAGLDQDRALGGLLALRGAGGGW